jgi:hypothetical protein
LVNQVAHRDLAQIDWYALKDADGKRKHIDDVLQWCRKHAAMGRAGLLLEVMAETKDQSIFLEAAREIVASHTKDVTAILIKRQDAFPAAQAEFARL